MQDDYKPLPKSKRRYVDDGTRLACEHCDCNNTFRIDYLRGQVCADCDLAIDAMLEDFDWAEAA